MSQLFVPFFLIVITETVRANGPILSAYEKRLNEIQRKGDDGHPIIKNGKLKRLKCVEEHIPLNEIENAANQEEPLKSPFTKQLKLSKEGVMKSNAEINERMELPNWFKKRNEFDTEAAQQFTGKRTNSVDDDGAMLEFGNDDEYYERLGQRHNQRTRIEAEIPYRRTQPADNDVIDIVEGPFFKYWQQENRLPLRRSLRPLPLIIKVKKWPAFEVPEKKKTAPPFVVDDVPIAPKHLKTESRARPRSLRIHSLFSLPVAEQLATSSVSDGLIAPSSVSPSSQQRNISPPSSFRQRHISAMVAATATSTMIPLRNTIDSVKATAANCQKIKFLASTIGLSDVHSWTRQNCALLRIYAPQSTCDQIVAFVDSCYS